MDEKERQEKIEELSVELQGIANSNGVLVLSFIAPDKSVKVSPVGVAYASMDIEDIYAIENAVETLEKDGPLPKTLHLIIQTPGGFAHVATKIAKFLRNTFEDIHVFVPYEASSGGTVLCLAANRVTMGRMANLTPIDPQGVYKGQRVSVASYQQAINSFKDSYGTTSPEDIPPPYQQMGEKFDPVIWREMNKSASDAVLVAFELLEQSYKPQTEADIEKILTTARSLVLSPRPHSHMINSQEAARIGIEIDNTNKSKKLLQTYKNWVSLILREEKASHVIHNFKPAKQKKARAPAKRSQR